MIKNTTLLLSFIAILNFNYSFSQCSYAVQTDGTDEFLYSPFNDYTFTNFTLECWINVPTYESNVHYISLYQNVYVVLGDYAGGSFSTWADGLSPIDVTSSMIATTDTWHHVAFVYDGTSQIVYIDGVADVTAATTGTVTHNNTTFNQGLVINARYTQGTQFVNGMIDEVRIWNVARTPAEISGEMNNLLTGSETGLVAYYSFEDGPGSTTVTDVTGNGNDLTLTNMDPASDWVVNGLTNPLITTVTETGNTLTSDDTGSTYQWLDCDSSYAAISGETNQSYTPTTTGNYAVQVTNGNCVDTSECLFVDFTSLSEHDLGGLSIYPNPSTGNFNVHYDGVVERVDVLDLLGRKVLSTNNSKSINGTDLQIGRYVVRIKTSKGITNRDLVILK